MNPVDRAQLVLDHATAHGLEDGISALLYLNYDTVGIDLSSARIPQLVRWGDSLDKPRAEIVHHAGTFHLRIHGQLDALSVTICLIAKNGPVYDRINISGASGDLSFEAFRRLAEVTA